MNEPTFDPRRKAAIRDLVVANAEAHPGRAGGRKRTALIATLVVLALSISGGTVAYALGTGLIDLTPAAAPTATPTPAVTETPTPTPTPTPTATEPPQDLADTSTWVIGFDSVGPLTVGAPFASQAQGIPAFQDVTASICVDEQRDYRTAGDLTFQLIAAADSSGGTAAIQFGNYGYGSGNGSASPRTPEGIGITSTRDELFAAYPSIHETGGYSDSVIYYGRTDGQGNWMVFGVMHDEVFTIQLGNDAVQPVGQRTVRGIPSERCPA